MKFSKKETVEAGVIPASRARSLSQDRLPFWYVVEEQLFLCSLCCQVSCLLGELGAGQVRRELDSKEQLQVNMLFRECQRSPGGDRHNV